MICQRCQFEWDDKHGTLVRCPSCKLNHTTTKNRFGRVIEGDLKMVPLSDVEADDTDRLVTGPWDSAWGGGIPKKSITLFGGEEGTGKSTLVLQICDAVVTRTKGTVYYFAAEEDPSEIKKRGQRIKLKNLPQILISENMIDDEYEMLNLLNSSNTFPSMVILDSLPGLLSENLTGQVDLLKMLKMWSNDTDCPVIIINHLNKDNTFSGLRSLAYLVDITMIFEKDQTDKKRRLLRVDKSRYGTADKYIGFLMTETGLKHYQYSSKE